MADKLELEVGTDVLLLETGDALLLEEAAVGQQLFTLINEMGY